MANQPVRDGSPEQLLQRWMQDNGVDRCIHGIEDPSQPGDEQDEPLITRDAVAPGSVVHDVVLGHNGVPG